eukprot:scaffold390_cov191-Alexandrium_tamarense.AAC.8
MGRYSATQLEDPDEDDCDTAEPMDWTALPDEHKDQHFDGQSTCCNDDSTSLVQYAPQHSTNDNSVDHSVEERGDYNGYDDRAHHVNTVHNNDNSQALLEMAQQLHQSFQQSHEDYINQQRMLEAQIRQRRRRIFFTSIIFAIVAFVLKRHAPPPPPLGDSIPYTTTFLSNKLDIGEPGVTQPETWGEYSRHMFRLVTNAIVYGVSVIWYAVSNAFGYAAREVKDVSVKLFHGGIRDNWMAISGGWNMTFLFLGQLYEPVQDNDQWENINHSELDDNTPCPIRIPAAGNRHKSLPRGVASSSAIEGYSTEEYLRQTIGTSLSPQNLALTLIAEKIDEWGEALMEEAPVESVHRMATVVDAGSWRSVINEKWILPPSIGLLLVGPEGVGKVHTARRLAQWMLGHCVKDDATRQSTCLASSEEEDATCHFPATYRERMEGFIELNAKDYADSGSDDDTELQHVHPIKKMVVDHIRERDGLGSIVLIRHVDLLPVSFLSELAIVLSGKSHTLSYITDNESIEVSCNGTVFVFTSKLWGSKSIFNQIQMNGGMSRLRRDPLIASIRWEVDSHLGYWSKLGSHVSIVPFLPFQQDDLSSMLRSKVQLMNVRFKGVNWKRLEVSNTSLDLFVGSNHVEYFDLYDNESERGSPLLTFSTSGGNALDHNSPWKALKNKLSHTKRRPYKVAFVDIDVENDGWKTVLEWCEDGESGLEGCEVEWRLFLN